MTNEEFNARFWPMYWSMNAEQRKQMDGMIIGTAIADIDPEDKKAVNQLVSSLMEKTRLRE